MIPRPGRVSESVASVAEIPISVAFSITAFARGCSLVFSTEAASSIRYLSFPSRLIISVTTGLPSVTVPVLSIATVLTLPRFSIAAAVLYRIPFEAPTPLPTIIATGVARPSAQGQLITKTEIAREMAKLKGFPVISQTIIVTKAMAKTLGTKIAETLSAMRASGAFVAAASDTIAIILLRVVSSPTLTARQRI